MKILLDENLPHQLRMELPDYHECFTVAFMEWTGIENGELLRRAAERGFEVLITNDRGLEYEQNLEALPVAVIVLLASSNTIEAIRTMYDDLFAALDQLRPCEFLKLPSR